MDLPRSRSVPAPWVPLVKSRQAAAGPLHARTDLVFPKTHGVASLGSTGVDAALRNLGVEEIVLAGVSVNVAIPALAFEAVNHGYRVTIPRDAVAGVPSAYTEQMLNNTLALVETLTTVDELTHRWSAD